MKLQQAYNVNVKASTPCGAPGCDCREVLAMFPTPEAAQRFIDNASGPFEDASIGLTTFELVDTVKDYRDGVRVITLDADSLGDLFEAFFGKEN